MINLGVSGTRNGMNDKQKESLNTVISKLIEAYPDLKVFHQGQCVGVDVQVANILAEIGFNIVSHPPIKKDLIGVSVVHESKEPKHYFERNRCIVDSADIMLIIPSTNSRQNYGGTWYTYDYASKYKKPIYILYPDGRVIEENQE